MDLSPGDTARLIRELKILGEDVCANGHPIGTRQLVCEIRHAETDNAYAFVTLICEVCLTTVADVTCSDYPYLDDVDDLIIVLNDGVWRRT